MVRMFTYNDQTWEAEPMAAGQAAAGHVIGVRFTCRVRSVVAWGSVNGRLDRLTDHQLRSALAAALGDVAGETPSRA